MIVSAIPASQDSNQPLTQEFARDEEDNEVQLNPTVSRVRTPAKSPVRATLRVSQTARGRRAHFASAVVSISVDETYDDTLNADARLYWPMGSERCAEKARTNY